MKRISIVYILLLILFFGACTVTRYEPIGLGLPSRVSSTEVMGAINKGILEAGWFIEKRGNSTFLTKLEKNQREARVRIDYSHSSKIVSFSFLDSKNMKQKSSLGVDKIYYTYNTNLMQLEKSVALKLAGILAE